MSDSTRSARSTSARSSRHSDAARSSRSSRSRRSEETTLQQDATQAANTIAKTGQDVAQKIDGLGKQVAPAVHSVVEACGGVSLHHHDDIKMLFSMTVNLF